MHLWPSLRLRDSFKESYLKKLEWNLSRMNSEKQQQNQSGSSNQQEKRLLEKEDDTGCGGGFVYIFREVLLVLSCCYCCFCCGACVEDEESY